MSKINEMIAEIYKLLPKLSDLTERIENIESRLNEVESFELSAPDFSGDIEAIKADFEKLSKQPKLSIDDINKTLELSRKSTGEQISQHYLELSKRLDKLEQKHGE